MGFHRQEVCSAAHGVYGDVLRKQGTPVRNPCNHGSTEQFKSAYKEVEMARLHQQIRFYISFALVNTIA